LKRILCIIICGVMLISVLSGCNGVKNSVDTPEGEVTIPVPEEGEILCVGEAACRVDIAKLFVAAQKSLMSGAFEEAIWSVQIGGENLEAYVSDGLRSRIALFFATAQMAKADGLTLSESEQALVNGAAAAFYRQLSDTDQDLIELSLDELTEFFSDYRLAVLEYKAICSEKSVEVSEDEARIICLQQIKIVTKGLDDVALEEKRLKMEECLEQLEKGMDFLVAARRYNEGGEIEFQVARGDLSEPANSEAFALATGEVSGLIEMGGSFLVLKCINSFVEEESEARRQMLLEEKGKTYFSEKLMTFLKSHPLVWNETEWDSLSLESFPDSTQLNFSKVYKKYFGG